MLMSSLSRFPVQAVQASNPQGPASGTSKTMRGGSWSEDDDLLHCAHRFYVNGDPYGWGNDNGFRLAANVK